MDKDKSLMPLEGEKFTDLEAIRQKKHEDALRNLYTGTTPREVIFQRPIRGGAQVDYVPGWWFVEQLNALFGHLWDFEVLDQFVGEKQVWVKGRIVAKGPEGMTVSKTAFGGSEIKKYSDKSDKFGQVIDIGDDLKAAATDALKKAATLLGIAADIYGKREVLEQTSPQKAQLETLYKIGKGKGMDKEAVDAFCVEESGKELDELEAVEVLGLVAKLRSK